MWLLYILFLFLPILGMQYLADRPVQHSPDYAFEQMTPEVGQFVSYTKAIEGKVANTKASEASYATAWTHADLDPYKSMPVFTFPTGDHGNCLTEAVTLRYEVNPGVYSTYTVRFRIAWISPVSGDWRADTKRLDEKMFGIYDVDSRTIQTNGVWNTIPLCTQLTRDSILFAVQQEAVALERNS